MRCAEEAKRIDGVGGVKAYPLGNNGTALLIAISDVWEPPSPVLLAEIRSKLNTAQNQSQGHGTAPAGQVIVRGVSYFSIDLTSRITLEDGWLWRDAELLIREALSNCFAALASCWADSGFGLMVRISQIENVISQLPCVLNMTDTLICGRPSDLRLATEEIPKLGALILS